MASQILKEVLPYLEIPSDTSTNNTSNNTKSLPNVKNKTVAEAKKIIEKAGFNCKISGESEDLVTEQMPRAGTNLMSGATVLLYTEGNDTRVSSTVPNLKGMTITEAKSALKKEEFEYKNNRKRNCYKPRCNSRNCSRRGNSYWCYITKTSC